MNMRILTGFAVGFAALFSMIAGGFWLAGILLAIIWLATKEYSTILVNKGFLPSRKIILLSSIIFALLATFNRFDLVPLVFTLSAVTSFMWVLFRGKQPYIANVATTILGFLYCGWFPLHILFLRNEGAEYCMLILFGVLATDTFSYFIGSKYGKHKLCPVISPNKTIEGAIGGSIVSLIFSISICTCIGLPWYHSLILGLLITTFAQIGDLCESLIKREAGVKDSSNVLPGHGGLLDRTDSYILTIPVVYYYLQYCVNTNIFVDLFKGLF